MAEGDRLGDLQVCKAGHDRIGVFFGLREQCPAQLKQKGFYMVNFLTEIQSNICCNLVIA